MVRTSSWALLPSGFSFRDEARSIPADRNSRERRPRPTPGTLATISSRLLTIDVASYWTGCEPVPTSSLTSAAIEPISAALPWESSSGFWRSAIRPQTRGTAVHSLAQLTGDFVEVGTGEGAAVLVAGQGVVVAGPPMVDAHAAQLLMRFWLV